MKEQYSGQARIRSEKNFCDGRRGQGSRTSERGREKRTVKGWSNLRSLRELVSNCRWRLRLLRWGGGGGGGGGKGNGEGWTSRVEETGGTAADPRTADLDRERNEREVGWQLDVGTSSLSSLSSSSLLPTLLFLFASQGGAIPTQDSHAPVPLPPPNRAALLGAPFPPLIPHNSPRRPRLTLWRNRRFLLLL